MRLAKAVESCGERGLGGGCLDRGFVLRHGFGLGFSGWLVGYDWLGFEHGLGFEEGVGLGLRLG